MKIEDIPWKLHLYCPNWLLNFSTRKFWVACFIYVLVMPLEIPIHYFITWCRNPVQTVNIWLQLWNRFKWCFCLRQLDAIAWKSDVGRFAILRKQNMYLQVSSNKNPFPGPGEFPAQRPVTRSFDVFFDLRLNKQLSKQPWGWWFETLP